MAKSYKKKTVDLDDIAKRVSKLAQNAVGVNDVEISNRMETAFNLYMRKAMAGDDEDRMFGRSKHVSNEVQRAVDWSTSTAIRVFDSVQEVVRFAGNTKDQKDTEKAEQMTKAINFIVRQKNSHVAMLYPTFKNAFLTGLGVAYIEMKCQENKEGLIETIKGQTAEQLVEWDKREQDGTIVIVGASDEPYEAEKPELPEGLPPEMMQIADQVLGSMPPQLVWDIQVRKIKKKHVEVNIISIPPEDFIVSKDADFNQQTGGISARIQGHKRIMSRADLLDMEFDEAEVMRIPAADDRTEGLALARSEVTDYDQGITDVDDNVVVYQIFTKMAITDEKRRDYRVTLAGDIATSPVVLGYDEVTEYYPYAAFTPYPTSNTLFGEGVADRVGADQDLISKMVRAMHDNLNLSVNPAKILNTDVTNMEDALNMHAGSIIRSTDPTGGITYNQPAFAGGNVLPVIQSLSDGIDFATGVGPSFMSINASDLQNSTATASSQRANSSQLFMELVCRWFAETGYRYMFKVIVDLLVANPEDAEVFIKRLTDSYTPIQVDAWDPDMDVSANVAFGVMNKDFNAAQLSQLLALQMQAKQAGMRFVGDEQIYNTLVKIAENGGQKNPNEFFLDPKTLPPIQPQSPIDPNAGLIEVEKIKAQLRAQSDEAGRVFEAQKLMVIEDRIRDLADADFELKKAENEARYGAQVDIAKINAAQAATRHDFDYAISQQDAQNQAMQHMSEYRQGQDQRRHEIEQAQKAEQAEVIMEQQQAQQGPEQGPMMPMGE